MRAGQSTDSYTRILSSLVAPVARKRLFADLLMRRCNLLTRNHSHRQEVNHRRSTALEAVDKDEYV